MRRGKARRTWRSCDVMPTRRWTRRGRSPTRSLPRKHATPRRSETQNRLDAPAVDLPLSLQEVQDHKEAQPDDLGPDALQQVAGCARRATCRQHVVHDQYPRRALASVGVDLEPVRSVLQRVLDAGRLVRKLAWFPDWDEADAEL